MSVFHGRIIKGELVLDIPRYWKNYLSTFAEGQRVTISLKKFYKKRSLPQNAYWHGVVCRELGNHLGYHPEEMHEALKIKFCGEFDKNGLVKVRSTTKLDTVEFNALIERVCQWAAEEFGLYIPPPNEAS